MVFFTCSYCGESVKKPSVSKHYATKCRSRDPFLTCVDCLKDFKGSEYEAHTKCITEDERYSAKGYVPKPSQNKGERKQQAWQECIQSVLKKPTLKHDERDLIQAISKYENVPRKKSKFVNFLKNALRQYANKSDLIDRVWEEMESVFKQMSASSNAEKEPEKDVKSEQENKNQDMSAPASEETEENMTKKEKKRKRKTEEGKVTEPSDADNVNEKIKKKKTKHTEDNVVENSDESQSKGTDDQQEKKNRKRKAEENGKVEQNGSGPEEVESGKKKKKKHDKSAENQIPENTQQNTEEVSKSKKKRKKSKSEEGESKSAEEVTAAAVCNGVKKQKKSENKENCIEKTNGVSSEDAETEKPAPKKKKTGGDDDAEEQEKFDWKATILRVLKEVVEFTDSALKLRSKVMSCYLERIVFFVNGPAVVEMAEVSANYRICHILQFECPTVMVSEDFLTLRMQQNSGYFKFALRNFLKQTNGDGIIVLGLKLSNLVLSSRGMEDQYFDFKDIPQLSGLHKAVKRILLTFR